MLCLTNVIGITRTPCACIADSLPPDYTVSDSGLYLDELAESPINLRAINSSADCGKDLPFILTSARTNAVAEFRRELFKMMQERFKQRSVPYVGFVGSLSYSAAMTITDDWAGLVLEARNFRGASITINKIHAAFNATASFDIGVYKVSGAETTLVSVIPVLSLAGGTKENVLPVPLVLPLADETGAYLQYYFIYAREAIGFQPKNNLVSCGCGNKENDLKQFVWTKGVTGNDTAQLKSFSRANESMGLVLEVDARCGNDDIICKAYDSNEFMKIAIQYSILRKAVENLIVGILNSSEINRYTMERREQMGWNASNLRKKFANDIQWIAENIDISDNDCYQCNEGSDVYQMGGIRL